LSSSLIEIQRHQLDNGLTILTREDHSVPIVTSMIWYRVGSGHEEPATTGTSHFLEHMMFKGTKRFGKGEIDRITTQLGGFNNAFTSLDYTTYFFSFGSDEPTENILKVHKLLQHWTAGQHGVGTWHGAGPVMAQKIMLQRVIDYERDKNLVKRTLNIE